MENGFLIAQIIGLFAMALCIFAWQLKDSRKIILCYSPVNALWALHFVFLGAYSGATLAILTSAKDGLLANISPKYIALLIFSFLGLVWAATLYNASYWYDFVPPIATTFFNIILFIDRDNRQAITRASIISSFSWIIYNCFVGGWVGVICATFVIFSTLTGMARHENWQVGRCYRTFAPSLMKSLFTFPSFRTYS